MSKMQVADRTGKSGVRFALTNTSPSPPRTGDCAIGLAQGSEASLSITDDTGSTIWKVSYRPNPR